MRETVEMCTPEARATSRMVTGTQAPFIDVSAVTVPPINANGCSSVNGDWLQLRFDGTPPMPSNRDKQGRRTPIYDAPLTRPDRS
ncbi:hypothetical protein Jiend_01940 [Micromonospora endophytica]|nr:hypothetical protein Jiend_01940 [Micromonospora endophytica]